jgi:hypothetical protein
VAHLARVQQIGSELERRNLSTGRIVNVLFDVNQTDWPEANSSPYNKMGRRGFMYSIIYFSINKQILD